MTVGSSLLIIPVMAEYFDVSELAVQWIASAFTLAYCFLEQSPVLFIRDMYHSGLLVAGRLADLHGRKRLFILGLAISAVANIISGILSSRIALTVFRSLAGLALSLSTPAGFGILGITFRHEPARTMAFAALGAGAPLGAVLGEVVGGVLAGTGRKGWRYLYFLIAGVNILPIVGALLYIPHDALSQEPSLYIPHDALSQEPSETPDTPGRGGSRKVDWVGAGLVTLALTLLLFSVTQSGLVETGWREPYIPVIFALSILLLAAFILWEHHTEHHTPTPPIVKLSIFTRHKWGISAILLIAFFNWCGICGCITGTSMYYRKLLGLSPLTNAWRIIPAPITGVLCTYVPAAPPQDSPMHCLRYKILPMGGDFTIPTGSVMISNLCADDEQSVAGALFQVSLQVAATVDTCLSSFILVSVERRKGLLEGLRACLWFNAGCSWFAIVVVLLVFRKAGLAKDVGKVCE
ncbi:hypothetical protein IAT38_000260 [Cryptococcus sp. DSM 104549]